MWEGIAQDHLPVFRSTLMLKAGGVVVVGVLVGGVFSAQEENMKELKLC